MNPNIVVVVVAAACLILSGTLILGYDGSEDPPVETESNDESIEWPGCTTGGNLDMVYGGDGKVTFTAESANAARWEFQHWLGPDGEIDRSNVKTFDIDQARYWTAVFVEVTV